jgi:hypothetical protein
MNIRVSASANGTRNTGPVNMGGGSNLVQRSLFSTNTPSLSYSSWYTPGTGSPAVSTSDYYLMNGIYWSRPYDLDTMGSEGATIKAREGLRYVWMMGTDHPGGINYQGCGDFYVGYSNDPQVWPDPSTLRMLRRQEDSINVVDQNGYTQNSFFPYMLPYLVYNPDSSGDKFYIYAEGQSSSSSRQHELTLFTTSDFLTTTLVGPTIPTTSFNGWTSFGRPRRIGVNDWEVYTFGKIDGSATSAVHYKYTSTDGWAWTPDYSTIRAGGGPWLTVSSQEYLLTRESRTDNDYLSLLAVNASRVSLGTYTRISNAFGPSSGDGTAYPGPTYLQDADAYEEDGVASIYVSRGYFNSGPSYALNTGPFLNNSPTFYNITGSITSNVLDVTSVPGGVPSLAVGQQLLFLSGQPVITSFGTGSGGAGTYNVSSTDNIASQSIKVCTNGGLWQQFIDLYYYVTDATAAASAAPLGVTADCVSGTVTISWNNCLPHQNYRVYRGTNATTQATLIGDVTGISITDTPTAGSQYFYKVVTMNSGEQGSRVVSVYASNNTQMVNRHVNRVINDGGDTSKIDMTFLASVDSYLTTNDYYKHLLHWVDARFGVKLDGSGFISKVYCLGTTRLPRGGDYTPTTSNTFPSTSSNTSYSATSFRGTTPSWINNASSAHGYFGNGRANTIQRKNEITLIAAYQKPGTAIATLFGTGQFATGMYLQHASGSSGNVSFVMYESNHNSGTAITATVAFASATAAHVAAGVFDGSNMTAYLDGVAGTPVSASAYANPSMINDTVLRGTYRSTASTAVVLASGGRGIQTLLTRAYTIDNEALFTGAGLIVFDKGLGSTAISAIGAMYA